MASKPNIHSVALKNALAALPSLSLDDLRRLQVEVGEEAYHRAVKQATCPNCETVFTTKRAWQRYCSKKCRNEHFWKTHTVVKVAKEDVNEGVFE